MAFKLGSTTNRVTTGLLVTLAVGLLSKQWAIEACFVGPVMNYGHGLYRNLAVASEDMLEFMTSEGQVTSVTSPEFSSLSAVTYDPARGQMYLTDKGHDNASIFQFDVNTMKKTPLIPKQNISLHGIAYDPVSATLFWTTGHGNTIEMMSLVTGKTSIPQTLHKFPTETPMGIAVDNCKRLLYWTNSNHRGPSIERSSLNGSNREIVIKNDLFQPLGIAIDQTTNKLFWSDDREGIYYKIECSNLDGTNRKTMIHSTHQQPFSLTVGPEFIYWSDWVYNAVWSLPKKGHNHQPKMVKRYRSEIPMGLVAQISTECHEDVPVTSAEDSAITSTKNLTGTSQEVEQKIPDAASGECLNNGSPKGDGHTCDCPPGYDGERCEIPACFNYCLHGSCYLGPAGFAQCKCQLGYEGDRCHKDVCEGYCLNSGRCNVARGGEPVCKCTNEFKGQRCEKSKDLSKLGHYIITEELEAAENSTAHMLVASEPVRTFCENSVLGINNVIVIGLGSVIAIQLVIMLLLVRKVCMLRRRPRIKKHIIVKKNITPLTSRPPQQGEQCEITIENCCNMNICETPCFEPQLRTSKTLTKTEEKTNLLGSMEESPSCSPCQDDLY